MNPGFTSSPFAQAITVQTEASSWGLDWPDTGGVLDKVSEEVDEVRTALSADNLDAAKRELGDLLFTAVNLSRFLEADPGHALQDATARFTLRFTNFKTVALARGLNTKTCTAAQIDLLWCEAKVVSVQGLEKGLDRGTGSDANSGLADRQKP